MEGVIEYTAHIFKDDMSGTLCGESQQPIPQDDRLPPKNTIKLCQVCYRTAIGG